MAGLNVLEDTSTRLVFRMGVLAMLGHLTFYILIVTGVSLSLTLFLRNYLGIFAYIFIAGPGIFAVLCGFVGCGNARPFVFTFDRSRQIFAASSGDAIIERELCHIVLVHLERECGTGGYTSNSAPTFSIALLFDDGWRFRLEGGVTTSGNGRGPDKLHEQAEKIRCFLALPQQGIPVLDITRVAEEKIGNEEAEYWMRRWVSCKGIAPRFSAPVAEHDWVEPPVGVVLPLGMRMGGTQVQRLAPMGATVTVVGRVHEPPPEPHRVINVEIPLGSVPGQELIVASPDGRHVAVRVPPHMRPGEVMTIQY